MKAPEIYKKVCAIYSEGSLGLSKKVNDFLSVKGEYLVAFRFPIVNEKKKGFVESSENDYLSHIVGGEYAVLINNALVKIRPENILLVGLDDNQKSYFSHWPAKLVITVDSDEDIDKISFLKMNDQADTENKEHLIVIETARIIPRLLQKTWLGR